MQILNSGKEKHAMVRLAPFDEKARGMGEGEGGGARGGGGGGGGSGGGGGVWGDLGGGALNRNFSRGVWPTQQNPDPVQDIKDANFATLPKRKECCKFLTLLKPGRIKH